uniref:Btz domain-containing protein n=1 Tax=Haemonchus contortus TaxID=6289 RepID=A0A7I4YY08_HAECO
MDNKEFRNEIRRIINDRITMVAEELHEKGRRWADMFTEEDNRAIETYTIDSVGESEQEAAEWEEKRREKDRKRLKKAETGNHSNKSLENEGTASPKTSKSSSVEKAEVIPEDPVPQENCSELSTLNSSTSASTSNIEAAPSESNSQLQSDWPDRQMDDKDNLGVNVSISGEAPLQCKKDPVSVSGSHRNKSSEQGPQRRSAQDRQRNYRHKSSWSVRRINWRESRYSNTSNEAHSYTSHQGSRQQGLEWRSNGTVVDSQMHKNRDWSNHRMNWRNRPNLGFVNEHGNGYQSVGNWRRHYTLGFNEERYHRPLRDFPVESNYLHSSEPTNRQWWRRTRERRYRRY